MLIARVRSVMRWVSSPGRSGPSSEAAAWLPGGTARLVLSLFFLFLSIYLLTYRGLLSSIDGLVMYSMAESLARHGSLDTPQRLFAAYDYLDPKVMYEPTHSILASISLALAQVVPGLGNQQVVLLLNPIYTALTVALVAMLATEMGFGRRPAVIAALLYGLGGMPWPYTRTFYREPLLGLLLTLAFLATIRYRKSQAPRDAGLTLLLALAGVAVKTVAVVLVPVFGLGLLALTPPERRRRWVAAGLVAFIVAAAFAVVARGEWSRDQIASVLAGGQSLQGAWVAAYGMLLSPGKGILWYFPATLLGAWGLARWWRKWRIEAAMIAASILAFVGVYALQGGLWWGGTNWGPRYLLPVLPLMTVPAASVFEKSGRPRWMTWAVLVASTAIGLVASSTDWGVFYGALVERFPNPETTVLLDPQNWTLSPVVGQFATWQPANVDLLWLRPNGRDGGMSLSVGILLTLLGLLATAMTFAFYTSKARPWRIVRRALVAVSLTFAVGIVLFLVQAQAVPSSYPGMEISNLRSVAYEVSQAEGRKLLVSVSGDFGHNVLMNFLKGDISHYWMSPRQQDGFEILQDPIEGASRVFVVMDHISPGSTMQEEALFWVIDHAHYLRDEWLGGYRLYEFAPPVEGERHLRQATLEPALLAKFPQIPEVRFGEEIQLWGYQLLNTRVREGGFLYVSLLWEALTVPETDYVLSLLLIGPGERILGQVDLHPAGPRHPTSEWRKGEAIAETYAVPLWAVEFPSAAWVQIILYDPNTGERLEAADPAENPVGRVLVGPVKVEPVRPRRYSISNPLSYTLEGGIQFAGYDLGAPAATSGEALSLTLYWRPTVSPGGDYSVFTHLIDAEGRIWGQKDNVPVEGWYPTSLWDPGEVVRDPYLLPIDAATPPGRYRIEVGMYDPSSGRRLEVFKEPGVPEGGRILLPLEVGIMRSRDG